MLSTTCWHPHLEILTLGVKTNASPQHKEFLVAVEYRLNIIPRVVYSVKLYACGINQGVGAKTNIYS